MIDYQAVKIAIQRVLVTICPPGMPILYYEQNFPRPTIPYITFYLNTTNQLNNDWTSNHADSAGIVNMKGDRQFIVQLQAYGGDPLTLLENIRTLLQRNTVLSLLAVSGIAYWSTLSILDITDLVDSKFERRAQMDLSFGIAQTYTDNPGYFNKIELQEIYVDAEDAIVYDQTSIIPPA